MIVSQRVVYGYILEDNGGSVSSSAHPPLAAVIAKGIGSDDDLWVQAILEELEALGVVKITNNRSVEVIKTVDANILDDGDEASDDEEEDDGTVETVVKAEPSVPATSPSVMPAHKAVTMPSARQAITPAAAVRWTSVGERDPGARRRSGRPEDAGLAAAQRRIRQLTDKSARQARRIVLEQTRRGYVVAAAAADREARQAAEDRAARLAAEVEELRSQVAAAAEQAVQDQAGLRQELAESAAEVRQQRQALNQAGTTERGLRAELTRQGKKVIQLTSNIQRLETKAADLSRQLVRARKDQEESDDEIGSLDAQLGSALRALERLRNQRTIAHKDLNCGHVVTVMVDPGHDPVARSTCAMIKVDETVQQPFGARPSPPDPPRHEGPDRQGPSVTGANKCPPRPHSSQLCGR